MISRREFVSRLSAGYGAALTPGVLAAIVSGCQPAEGAGDFLEPRELQIVSDLADAIIPETDTPGARDAGVPQYIDMMLREFAPEKNVENCRAQLAWVAGWLDERNATGLGEVDSTERRQLLQLLDDQAFGDDPPDGGPAGDPALFALIKPLTVAGYYTSQAGAQLELHQPPFGPYRGDVPFDEIGKSWS